jgi:hypothetical protein
MNATRRYVQFLTKWSIAVCHCKLCWAKTHVVDQVLGKVTSILGELSDIKAFNCILEFRY